MTRAQVRTAAPRWVGGYYPLFVSRDKQDAMMTLQGTAIMAGLAA